QPVFLSVGKQRERLAVHCSLAHLLAIRGCEGNPAFDQRLERIGAELRTLQQAEIDTKTAGFPEPAASVHQRRIAWLDEHLYQHAIGVGAERIASYPADCDFTVGHQITGLDRTQPRRAEREAKPILTRRRRLSLGAHESHLLRRFRFTRGYFEVRAGDQRIEIGGTDDAELWPYHPETRAGTRNMLLCSSDSRPKDDQLQIVAEIDGLNPAHLQALVADRRTRAETV